MTLEAIRSMLGWCTLINWAMMLIWLLFMRVGHDWVYGLHGKWFGLSVQEFDAIHYRGLLTYKVGVFLFNFVPYLALRIIG